MGPTIPPFIVLLVLNDTIYSIIFMVHPLINSAHSYPFPQLLITLKKRFFNILAGHWGHKDGRGMVPALKGLCHEQTVEGWQREMCWSRGAGSRKGGPLDWSGKHSSGRHGSWRGEAVWVIWLGGRPEGHSALGGLQVLCHVTCSHAQGKHRGPVTQGGRA